jgi:Cu(I)/Ag(I) efflux system membrane protein CusA/SilA
MSLGGFILSLGVLIDMGVVLVENSHKYIEEGYDKLSAIKKSAMPVFFLSGEEGKLFRPLPWTKTLSMLISAILSITFVIILIYIFLPNEPFKTESLAIEIEKVLKSMKETKYVYAERNSNSYYIYIIPNRIKLAQYGISVYEIMEIINFAIGGSPITYSIENRERYPIRMRILRDFREIDFLKNMPIRTNSGFVLLKEICDIEIRRGFDMIRNENGFITSYVYLDTYEDYLRYIQKAKGLIDSFVKFENGYFYEFSGQYEDIKRFQSSLTFIIPITILIIFFLLYLNFNSILKSLFVLSLLPFPLFGSLLILKILNYNLSVAVWVGIIALLGISVEIIVVKIKFLDLGFEKFNDKYNAIHWAVVRRIRPIAITTLTAFFSLIPIMFEFSLGADILKRIVAPIICFGEIK